MLNFSVVETGIFRPNQPITTADVLATYVPMVSVAMVLAVWYRRVSVFHREVFQVSWPPLCHKWLSAENENTALYIFPK